MELYFAPMEGLTDSIYRRLHHTYFPGVDRYYSPFFSPSSQRTLTPREKRELPPADTIGYTLVPQILTKVPEDFRFMAEKCRELGYRQVNLNLGCPSGTVTAKGKGAGMLRDPEGLDRFLEEIFQNAPVDISLKVRLGFQNPEEFPRLLEIFNRYPVCQLILHPRVRVDFYNGSPRSSWVGYTLEHSSLPLCYNGDLKGLQDVEALSRQHPQIQAAMIGRGLIADPGMCTPGGTTVSALEGFFEALLEEYLVAFGGSRNAMFRLKENWFYLLPRFRNSEKLGKRLRKTTDLAEYRAITREIFQALPLI